ncbi:hypothetical protein A2803_02285 [Candidatus Woesebacteria bacterium RIFCSPHIGHO2_01_FULL_44_21]|uniref:Peptidase S11 D-alanyl-D-alanine carboxypeptidase A N-terminal domain-containing protein n=1 Tax=Candidatus Woesebacteria bacterium RIFCSPHIGHO2_01_FULL_44_21 TaxID=1802503 RepID=A0A1F7YW84_9BACT|nr:MAG: hypothetical protein A2803_02285 [Candidatus Woesebacteria bacterium RIFCSPHIGHO2_01_FULL_44_21]OGM70428.1 MAG: hypothetical protein A2897_01550 [Candidatus Woesebacteria bacterium RIFCSPLOWO2_01_FULL_44_24b]
MKLLKLARHFVFFGASAFVFAFTFLFYKNVAPSYVAKTAEAVDVTLTPTVPLTPKAPDYFPVISAQGVYAFELSSGRVLYEKDSEVPLFPASTTKIVTALVALDSYNFDAVLNTGKFSVTGSKMGLTWGENITARDLLYGLLIHSANDAAEVLAINFPGGRDRFIETMNEKAYALGAFNTHFSNPSGLDEEVQATTARDLARISAQAMGKPEFAEIVATESYTAHDTSGTTVHYLKNKNELLGKVPGVLGVKTGWTESARENLVTYVERDGKKVLTAVLGSQDRFGETEELIEWIFSEYYSAP